MNIPPLLAESIINTARRLAARGWTPATSSNFSARIDADTLAMTRSGADKGKLQREDIIAVDCQGYPVGHAIQPSAETALHVQLYQRFDDINAILHTHSRTQSVASRLFAEAGHIHLEGWELQKAITGISSHDSGMDLPVFENSQRMSDITVQVEAWLDSGQALHGYLIAGHGLYAWGRSMSEAHRHLEALDFLLACELDLRRLQGIADRPGA
ncbi:MAG: methylthioribulose 1-phosphate dehydratase [Rhodanobacteraceae bacterium]